MLNNLQHRFNRGDLGSFVWRPPGSKTEAPFLSPVILWLGGLKSSTMIFTVALNMFGQTIISFALPEWFTDTVCQHLLGNHEHDMDYTNH